MSFRTYTSRPEHVGDNFIESVTKVVDALNLSGPTGPRGNTGHTGSQGATGPTGMHGTAANTGATGPTGPSNVAAPDFSVQYNNGGVQAGDINFRYVPPSIFLGLSAPGTDSLQQGNLNGINFSVATGAFVGNSFGGRYIRVGEIIAFAWGLQGDVTTAGNNLFSFVVDLLPNFLPGGSNLGPVWYGVGSTSDPSESGAIPSSSFHRLTTVGPNTRYQPHFQFTTAYVNRNMYLTGIVVYQTTSSP